VLPAQTRPSPDTYMYAVILNLVCGAGCMCACASCSPWLHVQPAQCTCMTKVLDTQHVCGASCMCACARCHQHKLLTLAACPACTIYTYDENAVIHGKLVVQAACVLVHAATHEHKLLTLAACPACTIYTYDENAVIHTACVWCKLHVCLCMLPPTGRAAHPGCMSSLHSARAHMISCGGVSNASL
jgi:hypothetical protein